MIDSNYKLRAEITSQGTEPSSDFVEVNGYLANPHSGDFSVNIIPYGEHYAAPLRTTNSQLFGDVSNQVPGICNGVHTHSGQASGQVASTTLTGSGSGATFNYRFHSYGELDYIKAATTGSNYLVGDKLSITTNEGHVIEFRLVAGSNSRNISMQLMHDRAPALPFPVHRVRVNGPERKLLVYDKRSEHVFPKPQDKLLDEVPNAAGAYSLRRLRSAYKGPAIRVRNNTNDAKDIYFDAKGNLDEAAVVAHCNNTNSFIDIWYDQSGNGNHMVQNTAANRPVITWSDGRLIKNAYTGNPQIWMRGDGWAFFVGNHDDLYGQATFNAFFHYQTNDTRLILIAKANSGSYSFVPNKLSVDKDADQYWHVLEGYTGDPTLYANGSQVTLNRAPNADADPTQYTTRADLWTALVDNAASNNKGSIESHIGAGTTSWDAFTINGYSSNLENDRMMSEAIFYNTDVSSERAKIEANMNRYYDAF